MAIHVGIELSPVACRIVTIGATINAGADTRVRSYAIVPPDGVEMSAQLASLRRRSVAVVGAQMGANDATQPGVLGPLARMGLLVDRVGSVRHRHEGRGSRARDCGGAWAGRIRCSGNYCLRDTDTGTRYRQLRSSLRCGRSGLGNVRQFRGGI